MPHLFAFLLFLLFAVPSYATTADELKAKIDNYNKLYEEYRALVNENNKLFKIGEENAGQCLFYVEQFKKQQTDKNMVQMLKCLIPSYNELISLIIKMDEEHKIFQKLLQLEDELDSKKALLQFEEKLLLLDDNK